MPTAKPRLQSEVYPPKSCNSNREEGNSVTGYWSSFCMFLTALWADGKVICVLLRF